MIMKPHWQSVAPSLYKKRFNENKRWNSLLVFRHTGVGGTNLRAFRVIKIPLAFNAHLRVYNVDIFTLAYGVDRAFGTTYITGHTILSNLKRHLSVYLLEAKVPNIVA
jgi:hypothetical protein